MKTSINVQDCRYMRCIEGCSGSLFPQKGDYAYLDPASVLEVQGQLVGDFYLMNGTWAGGYSLERFEEVVKIFRVPVEFEGTMEIEVEVPWNPFNQRAAKEKAVKQARIDWEEGGCEDIWDHLHVDFQNAKEVN